jgi:hypothetical protein
VLGTKLTVTVEIEAGGKPCPLTTDVPLAATQSTTLGKPGSIPHNQCITHTCTSVRAASLAPVLLSPNASAVIGSDGSSMRIVLTNTDPTPAGFRVISTSYGRAS